MAAGRKIEVWRTPSYLEEREFAPFIKHREYTGHYDAINHITWSGDSRFFLTASKDLMAKVYSLNPVEGFVPTSLAGHRDSVIGAYFSKDQESVWPLYCKHCVRMYLLMYLWSFLARYIPSARMVHYLNGNGGRATKRMILMMRK